MTIETKYKYIQSYQVPQSPIKLKKKLD